MTISAVTEQLRSRYVERMPAKIAALLQAIDELAADPVEAEQVIRRIAHQVSGTAASFGYPQLGRQARQTEECPHEELAAEAGELLTALRACVAERGRGGRVLLVDDDPALHCLVTDLLEATDLVTVVAPTLEEAWEQIDCHDWDLVLLDLVFPDGDGRQLLSEMRAHEVANHIPVVVLSARTNALVHNECTVLGADAYIQKPIDPQTFALDVCATIERARRFRHHALTDPLTSLHNRRGFLPIFQHAAAKARREGQSLAVAVLDLDHFKSINDRYGHPAGDEVLATVAECLQERLRASDIICRWGGEEFVAVFPDTTEDGATLALTNVADRLRKEHPRLVACQVGGVTFSAGVTTLGKNEELASALLRADTRLYLAKRSGRDKILGTVDVTDSPDLRPRILFADDDEDFAGLLSADLEGEFDLVHAPAGDEALRLATERGPFDLALLDNRMPGMNGVELVHALRRIPHYQTVPIVMLTASGRDQDVEAVFEAGADDYVVKPYRRRALIARLHRHLQR